MTRFSMTALAVGMSLCIPLVAQADWSRTEAAAKGQTVFFNAWGGSEATNAYIAWVAQQVKTRYGVELRHVKVTDTAEVVKRVQTEVAAGRRTDGSVDLMWINGEN
ncbi:MAG: ABC transporter substrate-binding protein, partial [Hydrogenophaga sp.]|nr:ABC transporter substrate-binding protein [Hydrogenophaga sp.]